MPAFALSKRTREPRVHLVFDLDETLITGPEHWTRAALAGVLAMARAKDGLTLDNPAFIRKFNLWVVNKSQEAENLCNELSKAAGSHVDMAETFYFHVLRDEIYNRNPNDRRQFDKLIKRFRPNCNRARVRELAEIGASAYRSMRDENVGRGILGAMPGAPQALNKALGEGWNVAIASMGDQDKQEWKAKNLVLSKMVGGKKIPVFTTQRKFLLWRLKPGRKTPRFLNGLKKKMGVRRGDFVVMVGDRHDSDIVPALKAGFHYVVHVPGRRDEAYRKGEEQSQAHVVAGDLSEGMEKIMARVELFRREGK